MNYKETITESEIAREMTTGNKSKYIPNGNKQKFTFSSDYIIGWKVRTIGTSCLWQAKKIN